VSPIAKATSGLLVLRAVAADTRELCTTPHDAALPVLFIREQTQMGGFEPVYRHIYFIPNVLFIHLSLLCFKARVIFPALRYAKNGV